MKYNYVLIIGLLISVHALIANEKYDSAILAINDIYDSPGYEESKKFADILSNGINRNKGGWFLRKMREDNKNLIYYSDRNDMKTVLNAEKTQLMLKLPTHCGKVVKCIQDKIALIEDFSQEDHLNPMPSIILSVGIFSLGITAKIMKVWLQPTEWISLKNMILPIAGIVTGSLGIYSTIYGSYGLYKAVRFNNYNDTAQYNNKLKELKQEKNNWLQLKSRFESLIKSSETDSFA